MSRPRKDPARLAAVKAVGAVLDQRLPLGDSRAFRQRLDPQDAAFARRLAYGVLRWYVALDWLATGLLERPLKDRDSAVHRLILLGIYQLWKEDTPPHAAVHATAECARALGKPWAVGLVNAILRRFQREREERLSALHAEGPWHAHPPWLVEQIRADWPVQWRELLEENNREPPLWLRCNQRRQTVTELAARLRDEGFEVDIHPQAGQAVAIRPAVPVEKIPGFAEGACSVQDAAAQLAAPLLAVEPGQRVLDACAAPGGKTCHLLELQSEMDLTVVEMSAHRLERVQENLHRLGLAARLLTADALNTGDWWDGKAFDRILLDAPCSATGVIRRHPEIRLLRQPANVREAVRLQAALLDALWPLLQAGGILVYATCSVLKCENCEQIQKFLERTPDALCTGPGSEPTNGQATGRQILPGEAAMDGFYYAVLRKSA